MKRIDQQSALDPTEARDESVELVTLNSDQVTHGIGIGDALPFPDTKSALAYAENSLTKDERDCSWIRAGETVQPLTQNHEGLASASTQPLIQAERTTVDEKTNAAGDTDMNEGPR